MADEGAPESATDFVSEIVNDNDLIGGVDMGNLSSRVALSLSQSPTIPIHLPWKRIEKGADQGQEIEGLKHHDMTDQQSARSTSKPTPMFAIGRLAVESSKCNALQVTLERVCNVVWRFLWSRKSSGDLLLRLKSNVSQPPIPVFFAAKCIPSSRLETGTVLRPRS